MISSHICLDLFSKRKEFFYERKIPAGKNHHLVFVQWNTIPNILDRCILGVLLPPFWLPWVRNEGQATCAEALRSSDPKHTDTVMKKQQGQTWAAGNPWLDGAASQA